MLKSLFIALICYAPIIGGYLPHTNFGPGIPDIGAVIALSYILFLVSILQWSILKNVKFLNLWIGILAFYSVIVFASVYWSQLSYNGSTLQIMMNSVLMPLFIAIIAFNLFIDKSTYNLFLKHLTLTGLILSFISILQLISAILLSKEAFRATGTFEKPNACAIYLVMFLPQILYAVEKKIVNKTFGWWTIFFLVGGITSTVSRKGIATMILTFCIYNYLKKNFKHLVIGLFAFLVLAIAISGLSMISNRFDQDAVNTEIDGKLSLTKTGWEMFKKSPYIGLGFKGYYNNYRKYYPNTSKEGYDAHNIFITVLSDYGLLGFFPFINIFIYPLYLGLKNIRNYFDRENPKKAPFDNNCIDISIVTISIIIPFMISGWFAGGLLFNVEAILMFYTSISAIFACSYRAKYDTSSS